MTPLQKAGWIDHLKLHLVILVWGFTGILGKLITISSLGIVWYRMGLASLSLLLFFSLGRKTLIDKANPVWQYLATGVIVGLHWALFFEALKVSTVSVTLTTLASATLFTALLEPLFFRKKVVLYELIFGLLIIAGLLMIFKFEPQYHFGIFYSLLSAFFASLFTTINGIFIGRGGSSRSITFYEMLGGFAGMTAYLGISGMLNSDTLSLFAHGTPAFISDLIYILILAVICTAVAFDISVDVMKKLSPFTVSISINMEPVYAIILALIIFGEAEKMTPGFYIGAVLIMLTILGNAFLKHNMKGRHLSTSVNK